MTDYWKDQSAKYEMRKLAERVMRPNDYGRELDPTHPLSMLLKSFQPEY